MLPSEGKERLREYARIEVWTAPDVPHLPLLPICPGFIVFVGVLIGLLFEQIFVLQFSIISSPLFTIPTIL